MPNRNAVVSSVVRFDPSLEKVAAELRVERFVVLADQTQVRLDPADPRSIGFTRILEGLAKLKAPVYLELDAETSNITRLLIPHLSRVSAVSEIGDAGFAVELEYSHARHLLRRGAADFDELQSKLREALQTRAPVILTEDDEHSIVDLRFFKPGTDYPFHEVEQEKPGPKSTSWICRLFRCCPLRWFCCISAKRAQLVFNMMSSTSCDPLTVPPPCIPFRYPDDGCWARAHEMCRLMIGMGLKPKKVWIRASPGHFLTVSTRNNPNCHVDWGWHVAPILCVRGPGLFRTQSMVIDPSLFDKPVTKATWKSVQGDPGASLTDSAASQYWPSGGTDPSYTDTNIRLAYYRLQLQNRSIQFGPPPYAICP